MALQVVEVLNLTHLDSLVDMAGSAVVILFLYSKSCGGCKAVLRSYADLSRDYARQRADAITLQHLEVCHLCCLCVARHERCNRLRFHTCLKCNVRVTMSGMCKGSANHDIWGEFDELTDVARFHRHPRKKGPIVPSFVFFVEGALVQQVRMSDVRSLSGSAAAIERLQVYEHKVLQTALRQLIWKNTPSARR
eukprot:jgi/Astpho2/8220/fgenesh1_pg.00122_%23_4_t